MSLDPNTLFLLNAALDGQPLDSFDGVPDEQRYLAALDGSRPLTAEEKRQLWRSPAARICYVNARALYRAEQAEAWKRKGHHLTARRLAAAGGVSDTGTEIKAEDFTLTIRKDETDPQHPAWLLSLRLTPALRDKVLASGLELALVDAGRLVWLQGTPDRYGLLSADWSHPGSPLERWKQHRTLSLQPR